MKMFFGALNLYMLLTSSVSFYDSWPIVRFVLSRRGGYSTGNAESLQLHSAEMKSPRTLGESLPGESNLILIGQHS